MTSDIHRAQTADPDPAAAASRRVLRTVAWWAPLAWLRAGLADLRAAPWTAAFYGGCFWAMAWVIGAVFRNRPEYTMTFVSGCFLVGPFLALGLYEVSRRREQGLPQSLAASLGCWQGHMGSLGLLVLVLLLLELLWGRASLVVFAVFFHTGMPSTASVVQAVFNPDNWAFVAAYTAVGGVFAALVFGTCAVSLPMILDRDTDAITAGLASLQAVTGRALPMLLWGATIVLLLGAALWSPGAAGLWLVGPWLGHATWHAYRGCFDWEPLPGGAA